MNAIVQTINSAGREFIDFALPMLIQSSVLILILLLIDIALRRKVRAVFRYWIWMLVLLKLVLPTSLWSPVSFGTWFGDALEAPTIVLRETPDLEQSPATSTAQPQAKAPDRASGTTIPPDFIEDIRPSRTATPSHLAPTPTHNPQEVPAPIQTPSAPPATELAASTPTLDWPALVLLGWLAVVIALSLLLLQRALFVKGLVAQAEAAPARLQAALDECRTRMGLSNSLSLKISPNAASPAVCGLLRPTILIPRTLAPKLQPRDLEAVLLHELAHIKRGDLWINLAQTLLQIAYFYNPLLWLANMQIRRVREQAVDETVLVAMGDTARDYPDTLINVAKLAFRKRPALSLRLIGVVESKSALSGRIKHILNHPIPKSARLGLWGLLTIIIFAAVFLPMAKARPMTDRARQIMELAETEARSLNHSYVGTEHILLALMRQDDAISAKVLANLGVDIDTLRAEVNKLLKPGPEPGTKRRLPRTPRAQRVIGYAKEEAKALNHDYLGTEHILLGLMREKEGIAAQVLGNLGLTWQQIRAETLRLVRPGSTPPPDPETAPETGARVTLPSGVEVELLGACEYPSKGKQWWRPDGSPLADAPYDKRGAWVIPNDRSKTPFEIALRVRYLPEHWEAMVQSPGNSWSGASDPPYKAGKRLHELRWLVMQADPDQTTCKIRCDIVEPWQTIARTAPQIDVSQQADESGVAFTRIEKAFSNGVSVTITGPVGDPNDARLYGARDLKRVIAVTKDGRIEESPFGGVLFHGEEPRRIVTRMKGERMEDTIPAGPPSDTGLGSATVYFPRLPLADIEQFQYQTRTLTSVEFRSVPLRPGKPTAVEVHVESADRPQDPRKITLPDCDHEPFMLDLATAKLLTIPKAESPAEMWQAIKTIGQGDLVYDSRALILVRDATTEANVTTVAESFKTYAIGQRLPEVLRVTTAEGRRYKINILADDDKACILTSSPIPTDKGAGGGVLVEGTTNPDPTEPTWVDLTDTAEPTANGISGQVLDPNGNPAPGAQVALCTNDKSATLLTGTLAPQGNPSSSAEIIETDADGSFSFSEDPNDFLIVAAHEIGFAQVESEAFVTPTTIQLQPWGRVEGTMYIGREPAVDETMWISQISSAQTGRKFSYRNQATTKTDGRFVIKKVPPGRLSVGLSRRTGGSSTAGISRQILVQPGQAVNIQLGGTGRPVVGRLIIPEEPIDFHHRFCSLTPSEPEPPRPADWSRMSGAERLQWYRQWYQTPQGQAHRNAIAQDPKRRSYSFEKGRDGAFRIEDVLPDKYKLHATYRHRPTSHRPARLIGPYTASIEVPPMAEVYTSKPLDLGDLVLGAPPTFRVGDTARPFETQTLDGNDIRLLDYRGRFVLLSFWSPASPPESETLRELHEYYRDDSTLQIIGFGGFDTLGQIRAYVQEQDVQWPQIYFGQSLDEGIAQPYGLPPLPSAMLIDPNGTIVATELRGENLTANVHEAIAKAYPRISGQVVDPNGDPIAGAQVALCTPDEGVAVSAGRLDAVALGHRGSDMRETDATGRFSFARRPKEFQIVAAHESGFVRVKNDQLTSPLTIQPQPWGRIEGTLRIGHRPGADRVVELVDPMSTGVERWIRYRDRAQTDAEGRFVMEKVPPRWTQIGYRVTMGRSFQSWTNRTPIHVPPGETVQLAIGGTGRPVIGKFVPPPGHEGPVDFTFGHRTLATITPRMPKPSGYILMTEDQRHQWHQQWRNTREGQEYIKSMQQDPNRRFHAFTLNADGTFHIPDVEPGQYELDVQLETGPPDQQPTEVIASYRATIEVPPMSQAYSDEPLDLGDLVLDIPDSSRQANHL